MFELLLLLLAQYAWLGLWLSSALIIGLALQTVLVANSPAGQFGPNVELLVFFGICIGLAIQIIFLIVLAASHQLHPLAIFLANGALLAASAWLLWRRPGNLLTLLAVFRQPLGVWLSILPVLLIIAAWLVRPLGPAAGSDPLTYHLPYARFYLEQGGLAINDTLRFPLHTHNVNLLYAVALLRPGPALAQMLHASMGWLSLLGIYGAARHWRGWPTAVLAASAVLLLDEFIFSFSAAFVDNGLMLFATAAFLAMTRWQEGQGKNWLWLAALFVGTAMGTKYLGTWFTLPLGLWVLWQSRSLALSMRFALLVSAVGLFWYLRSWWLVGNPLHPFAGELFGYSIWTAEDLQGQMLELGSHGLERTWQNLLLLPMKLFTEWQSFNGASGNVGWLIGLFMASCLFLPLQRAVLKPVHMVCLAYLVFWFWTSQVIRYLMIILPLMSLCTLVAWAELFSLLRVVVAGKLGWGGQKSLPAYGKALGLGLALVFMSYFSAQRFYRDLLWIPLSQQGQHQALLISQPAYAPALAALADKRIAQGPILQFQLAEFRWFFPGEVYGDWMGKYPFYQFGHVGESNHWEINSGEVLHKQLKSIGVSAVVFRKDPTIQFSPQALDSYRQHFEVVFESESVVLMVTR